MLRKLLVAVGALTVLVLGLFIHYYTPRPEVVVLTAPDVMRFDNGVDNGAVDARPDIGRSRDVRLIYARTPEGAVRTYTNEDALLYLKLDAGTVQSQVASILLDQSKGDLIPVEAWTIGWRLEALSMYPNLISLQKVPAEHVPVPWPTFVATVLTGLLLVGAWRLLRRAAAAARHAAESARRAAEEATTAAEALASRAAAAVTSSHSSQSGAAPRQLPRRPPPSVSTET